MAARVGRMDCDVRGAAPTPLRACLLLGVVDVDDGLLVILRLT